MRRAAAPGPRRARRGPCATGCTPTARRNVAVVVTDTAGRAWRHGPDRPRGRRWPGWSRWRTSPAAPTPTATRWPSPRPRWPTSSPALGELVTGKLGGRPVAVVRGLGDRVLPPGEHGPGATALQRPARAGHVRASAPARPCWPRWPGATPTASAPRPSQAEVARRARRRVGLDGVRARGLGRRRPARGPARPGRSGRARPPRRPRPRLAAAVRHGARRTPSRSHRSRLRRLHHRTAHPTGEGGRVAKNKARDNERRAIAEKLRKEQQRKERRRSMLILGVCIAVVVGLLVAAVIPYVKPDARRAQVANTKLSDLGASDQGRLLRPGQGADRDRQPGPRPRSAPRSPTPTHRPSFGNALGQLPPGLGDPRLLHPRGPARARADGAQPRARPHDPLVRRHGEDRQRRRTRSIESIGKKFGDSSATSWPPRGPPRTAAPSPSGKHVALTHWTGPEDQKGVTQYCGEPSGAVIDDFMKKLPRQRRPGARRRLTRHRVRSGQVGAAGAP